MTKLVAHRIYEDTQLLQAMVHPASQESVQRVLSASENDSDGRSQWMWVRLPNGDLLLGVFPQGTTYEACEKDAVFPSGK